MTYAIHTRLVNADGFRKTAIARVTLAGHTVHAVRRRSTISWAALNGVRMDAAQWIITDRKRRLQP
jgi:hypothetical protein